MIQERKNLPMPRIEALAVKNYRSLKHVELRGLNPLTLIIGENASGKSALLDAFSFMAECMGMGIKGAVNKRGGIKNLRTWGQTGAIEVALKYRERPEAPATIYHLAIDEGAGGLYVAEEWMQWKRGLKGNVCRFLEFRNGKGCAIGGMAPHEHDQPVNQILENPSSLAVDLLGQLSEYPRLTAFRRFLLNWQVDSVYGSTREGLRALPKSLAAALAEMNQRCPEELEPIRYFLQNDTPLGKYKECPDVLQRLLEETSLSQGMEALVSQLLRLHCRESQFLALEQPEQALHPSLLIKLAGEYRKVLEERQVVAVTHSPLLLDTMKPEEVWMLSADSSGHTQAYRAADMPGIRECTQQGALLGQLWTEGYFSEQSML